MSALWLPPQIPRQQTHAEHAKASEQYRASHQCCPECGSTHVCCTTAMSIVLPGQSEFANNNRADCECGWMGTVDQMVGEKA